MIWKFAICAKPSDTSASDGGMLERPGWLEVGIGLSVYLILLLPIVLKIVTLPDEQAALRGILGMAANGVAGVVAMLAACAVRLRNFRAFGFRPVESHWLLIAVALAVIAFGASLLIEHVYFSFITEPNTQGDFQAAARAGTLSLIILVIAGGLFTPIGEEVVFRGVIANALNRYGFLAGVVLSAAIFGVVHGPSVIMLLAFMIGIITGVLFRRTNSIWPCVVVHVVYNSLHLVDYST